MTIEADGTMHVEMPGPFARACGSIVTSEPGSVMRWGAIWTCCPLTPEIVADAIRLPKFRIAIPPMS
jgi:hypothetical protein